jgi:hypothetical protein
MDGFGGYMRSDFIVAAVTFSTVDPCTVPAVAISVVDPAPEAIACPLGEKENFATLEFNAAQVTRLVTSLVLPS